MRYLIYSNTGLTSKQIGLTTEIIESLKNSGNEIKIVLCNNILENCYFNRSHNVLGCASCQSRFNKLMSLIGIKSSEKIYLSKRKEAYNIKFPKFNDLAELLGYTYKGFKVGRGVASSIISYKRDYHITDDKYGNLIEIELKKAINVLLNFQNIMTEYQPDRIYLFNGRFSEVFPVVELAKKMQIPFYTMESGSGNNYELFKNHLPHSIKLRGENIHSFWKTKKEPERTLIAKKWFDDKRSGKSKFEISFTDKQKKGFIPSNFDKTKKNIAIFNSSEDELMAIMEWKTSLYEFQNQAIEQIVQHFSDNHNIHFYLRVHPNLGNVDNIQMREIKKMEYNNLTIIHPNSAIDTYQLMEVCDKIITFGSSAGIEATYWGTPSILYGKSFYLHLNCVYTPQSFAELEKLILQKNLKAKPQSSTYKFGFYMNGYGKKTEYFKFDGLNNSTYKNHKIRKIYFSVIVYILKYLKSISLWIRLHRIYFEKPITFSKLLKYK